MPPTAKLNPIYFSTNPLERVPSRANVRSFADALTALDSRDTFILTEDCVLAVRHKGRGDRPISIALQFRDWDILTYFNDRTFQFYGGRDPRPNLVARLNQFGPSGWFFQIKEGILHGNQRPADPKRRRKVCPETDYVLG